MNRIICLLGVVALGLTVYLGFSQSPRSAQAQVKTIAPASQPAAALSPEAAKAKVVIDKGLAYLKSKQNKDYSWGEGDIAPGLTGMCLKAFVQAGYDPDTDFIDKGFDRLVEFRRSDRLLILPGSQQGGFVHEVRQVRPHEVRGEARDFAQVDIGAQENIPGMDFQDSFPPVYVRAVHQHLPVEPSGAQKCGVQNFWPVGGGHDDDAFVRFEAIHLHQELVERLLALVVASEDVHPPGLS